MEADTARATIADAAAVNANRVRLAALHAAIGQPSVTPSIDHPGRFAQSDREGL